MILINEINTLSVSDWLIVSSRLLSVTHNLQIMVSRVPSPAAPVHENPTQKTKKL
jgi:hypothetical protein